MRRTVFAPTLIFLIFAVLLCGIYLRGKFIEKEYSNAVAMLENGSYEAAVESLENANPNKFNREDFRRGIFGEESGKYYKRSFPLYSYALARIEYEAENFENASICIEILPMDYYGELSREIGEFRSEFRQEYAEYKRKQSEEARAEKMKSDKQMRDYYKELIPYEGMREEFITYTDMGMYHEYESVIMGKGMRYEYIKHEYRWNSTKGSAILVVSCVDGVVNNVMKFYDHTHWTEDGKPIFEGKPASENAPKRPKKEEDDEDPYNVNNYYHAEDFYDDHYDDFFEFEEAEEYFNEHHKGY